MGNMAHGNFFSRALGKTAQRSTRETRSFSDPARRGYRQIHRPPNLRPLFSANFWPIRGGRNASTPLGYPLPSDNKISRLFVRPGMSRAIILSRIRLVPGRYQSQCSVGPRRAVRNSRTIRRFHIERNRRERSVRSLHPVCVVVCVVTVSSLPGFLQIAPYRSVPLTWAQTPVRTRA